MTARCRPSGGPITVYNGGGSGYRYDLATPIRLTRRPPATGLAIPMAVPMPPAPMARRLRILWCPLPTRGDASGARQPPAASASALRSYLAATAMVRSMAHGWIRGTAIDGGFGNGYWQLGFCALRPPPPAFARRHSRSCRVPSTGMESTIKIRRGTAGSGNAVMLRPGQRGVGRLASGASVTSTICSPLRGSARITAAWAWPGQQARRRSSPAPPVIRLRRRSWRSASAGREWR